MAIPSLSLRASVRLPWSRFQPLLPEPGVPISGTGLSSGIMRLAHGPPGRLRKTGGRTLPTSSADAARPPHCIPVSSPARRQACSRLDGVEPIRFVSFTYACDASGISALNAGTRRRHSRKPSSFRHRSTPEVPFLDRHYPASSVVRTSPPPRPARPAPRGGPVGACHAADGASRVASIPLLHACRRHYPGGTGRCPRRSLPSRWQPSPNRRRVGFRVSCFEACAAFTPVAACMLAEPPKAALLVEVLQAISLPPSPAPTATGWSDSCRAGFAPAEKWRLGTAHSHQYLTAIVIIKPSPNALPPDTGSRIHTLEKIHRHMTNHSEIMWRIASTNPALIFSKRHVQSPMQSILYPPMGTHRLVKWLHVIKRGDVVASFPTHLPFAMTFRLRRVGHWRAHP